jgi:hypothetical protein
VMALLCCAMFGWMMRFIPARRLKAAGQVAGTLPFLVLTLLSPIQKAIQTVNPGRWWPQQPVGRWSLAMLVFGISFWGVLAGIRFLSADYLIQVSSLMKGGADAGAKGHSSWLGAIVSRYFGGQPGRAGFMFVSRMMLRDWQFRRGFLPLLAPALIALVPAVARGWPEDPFSGQFAAIHLLPHLLGVLLLLLAVCCRMERIIRAPGSSPWLRRKPWTGSFGAYTHCSGSKSS